MKGFMKEFKEFISKGDVMSMAVGIIIGGAFTAIVTSVVEDIIGPLIGLLIGGLDFSTLSIGVGDAQIMFGNFIQAVINFLITALVLFLIIKSFNKMKEEADKLKKCVWKNASVFIRKRLCLLLYLTAQKPGGNLRGLYLHFVGKA
ncbi:MAG: large conductance mechanosensitive channel protein MscL, partial [Lachnospiraceae bacterium]|nr:large conductance mechanosensitive channel protein MscL [Lachnospiraceae bacterium]